MAVNYFLSTIGNDVEAFNNYATFRQATADNANPIPGYLVAEVNAITYEDNGTNCKAVVNYFISRLQAHSPLVKIKVLKLLLHLAKNGHKNVIEELKIHEVALKQAQNFSVAIDVQINKVFIEKIRKTAEELLTIAFNEEQSDDTPLLMKDTQPLSGLGSTATSKTLVGFGNSTSSHQKTFSSRVSEQVSNVMDRILSPTEDTHYKKQATVLAKSLPSYNPVSVSRSLSSDVFVKKYEEFPVPVSTPSAKSHVAGKAGGGWDDSDDEASDVSQDYVFKDASDGCSSKDGQEKSECPGSFEWVEEQELVNSFLLDQPLEVLQWGDIIAICKRASVLNGDKICKFLVENLIGSTSENQKLRSLILIEYLLHQDVVSPDSVSAIALPHLYRITQSPHSLVQIKSKKISLIIENLLGAKHKLGTTEIPSCISIEL